ncbi:hypothetical protein L916_04030 [Phytophthora nicotianae]|uniref:Uncharacterized protein n=1 Tax=Phytophthora nicotianae TaxID=4792 RepID=W2JJT6_PHYNI|nr:hypothetical protein L916_04030 [Phytophthora nicotianae]
MQSNTEEGNAPTPLRTSPYGKDRSTPQERSPSQDREQRSTSEEDRPEAGQAGTSAGPSCSHFFPWSWARSYGRCSCRKHDDKCSFYSQTSSYNTPSRHFADEPSLNWCSTYSSRS